MRKMFRELDGTYPEHKKTNYSLDIYKFKMLAQHAAKRTIDSKLIGIFVISPREKEDPIFDFDKRYKLFRKGIDYCTNRGQINDSFTYIDNRPGYELYHIGWNDINFLGESIKLLGKADLVIVAKDYEKDINCIFEYEVASKYKMNIIKEEDL